jgi:GTP cyclohydrolase I
MHDPLSRHCHGILQGLRDTPQRASKALRYLCYGYDTRLDERVNGALFSSSSTRQEFLQLLPRRS